MSCTTLTQADRDLAKIVSVIIQLTQGKNNAGGRVTLTPNMANTIVPAPNCADDSVPLLMPLTANAAAEFGNGTLYVSAIAREQFTITHANNSQNNRNFAWATIG